MKRLLSISVAALCCICYGSGKAYLTVKVVDSETAEPVPNIHVRCDFANFSRGWGIAAKDNRDDASTDAKGICRLSGFTEAGEASCVARGNAGYYNSGWYSLHYQERSLLKFGRWLPDNVVVTVRLDRIENPIPLCVGMLRQLPEHGGRDAFDDATVVLYDLLKNDWLPPWGLGVVGDVSFSCRKMILGKEPYRYPSGIHTNEFYRCDVKVSFMGVDNGMIEAIPPDQAGIRLRIAPEGGYISERVCWAGRMSRTERKDNFDKNRCYYFRIRAEHDENGQIIRARYGKIYGDFKLVGKEGGIKGVSFLYYLNPKSNDRNLEWDMTNNLCPNPGDIGEPGP